MKSIAVYVTTVALFLCAFSGEPACGAQQDNQVRSKPKTTTITGVIEQPMALSHNRPVVVTFINGQGPFNFAIDTGSAYLIIDDDLFRRVKPRGFREVKRGEETLTVIGIASLSLGGAVFSNFEAILLDFDAFEDGERSIDGTIGLPVFADTLLTLDYPNSQVRYEKASLPPADGRKIFKCENRDGMMAITFQFRITTVPAIIGSGTSGAFSIARHYENALLLMKDPKRVRGATSLADLHPIPTKANVTFGSYTLVQPPVYFFGNESTVGNEVLKHFSVTLDAKNGRARFLRDSMAPIEFVDPPKFGMVVRRKRGYYIIEKVIAGSVAARIGIKEGDRLLVVESTPAHQLDEYTLRNLLETLDDVALKLERHGMPYILRLKSENIE